MFDSREVAAYIAQECDRQGYGYNNTKIQKLLYIVYGIMLAWKNVRLCDEYPRAWPYGPVFPKVFHYIDSGKNIAFHSTTIAKSEDARDIRQAVQEAVACFGNKSASALSRWSHAKGSPWYRVVEEENAGWNSFIPDEFIRDYFLRNIVVIHEDVGTLPEGVHA